MLRTLRPFAALAALSLTAACAVIPEAPIVETLPAAEGTAVPLGKAVEVGALAVEPLRIIEDSRCPINARCIWAGRLVIEANIAGYSWGEIARVTLGEPHTTHGVTLVLTSGSPAPETGGTIPPEDYRFTFERR